ncbi:MAG: DUF624 domain-containing protein [Ruminococcus sp.]|nr:DUF624 domain-containing protein [Ruminococcus sp.]
MGLFSKDYESAGAGIAKNAPKKTGAKLFFELLGRKFWKLFEVNILYSLFFIPLILSGVLLFKLSDVNMTLALVVSLALLLVFAVLIGPSTAGMTKIMRSYVLEKNSFIIHDFFKAFKENFKKAAIVGFLDCLILVCVWAGYQVYPVLAQQMGSSLLYVPMVISLSLGLMVVMMNFYVFLMIIATDLSLKNLLKNSFALAFVELKKNFITFLIMLAIIVLLVFLTIYVSIAFVFVLPFFPAAFICFLACFNSYPVIQKYVINPYYASIGKVNPELGVDDEDDEEPIFEDMGGKEKPIEKRKKGRGKRIS